MQDYIPISQLGLSASEIKVLKSMFAHVPELKQSYKFLGFESSHGANIVVVNADDPATIKKWNEINPHFDNIVGSIMISNDEKIINGSMSIKRPLRIKKLLEALEAITRDQSIIIIPDSGSNANAKLRMLVVDDSFPVRKYMENKLTELNKLPLHLSFASNGEEAMQKVSQDKYDIIFLDVVMPGANGYKVCKAIKNGNNTYIVMLTSKKSPFDKIRGTMSGCNAFITKPPSDKRLQQEIQMCIEFRLKEQNKFKERSARPTV